MSDDYEPALLADELPKEILEKLPTNWTRHCADQTINHLLLWRHHLEGDYKAKVKNHDAVMKKLAEARAKGSSIAGSISQQLVEDNRLLLNAHDRLRNLENVINQQINEMEQQARLESERFNTKVLGWIAIVISIISLVLNSYKRNDSLEIASSVADSRVLKFFSEEWTGELRNQFKNEIKKPLEDRMSSIEGSLVEMRTQINRDRKVIKKKKERI
jgi:hypothetical protein